MNHIAIVGATGLVGSCFLDLLKENQVQISKLHLFASSKNQGQSLSFNQQEWPIKQLERGCFKDVQIAFFSAGSMVSREWAEQACEEGGFVIDNSSCFRMDPHIPLIVPEINASILTKKNLLISNPNCSTIQMCLALSPLHQVFGLQSVQVATYQSMSGAGGRPVQKLKNETKTALENQLCHKGMAFNLCPQIGEIKEDGFSLEDTKMQEETKKILDHPSLDITAFTVRVPTIQSHGEALWIQLQNPPKSRSHVIEVLKSQKGLKVISEIDRYPDNSMTTGKPYSYVGRIHQVPGNPLRWMMWVSCDNLRKGAALNGFQIAQHLKKEFL